MNLSFAFPAALRESVFYLSKHRKIKSGIKGLISCRRGKLPPFSENHRLLIPSNLEDESR
jgi:hypothetical protein